MTPIQIQEFVAQSPENKKLIDNLMADLASGKVSLNCGPQELVPWTEEDKQRLYAVLDKYRPEIKDEDHHGDTPG